MSAYKSLQRQSFSPALGRSIVSNKPAGRIVYEFQARDARSHLTRNSVTILTVACGFSSMIQ
jgi:hypothetical protein